MTNYINKKTISYYILSISLFTYSVSLLLPAYHAYEDWLGWYVLLLGPLGIIDSHFAWYANPFIVLSWLFILAQKKISAFISAFFSILIALTFLMRDRILVGDTHSNYTIEIGYYVWLVSIFLAITSSFLIPKAQE